MKNEIKAVIFDLDGTLVDSMWMWKSIDVEYLGRYGIAMPEDLQRCVDGMSFSETALYFKERFELPDSPEQIKNDWNEMAWDKYMHEVPLKPGVPELLDYLKSERIAIGIATSNSRELVDLVVEKLGIKEYFSSIRTSCEVTKGKPSPDIYLLVAQDLDVEPKDCLVFEDVLPGVMAGKNAGMKVCAVYDEHSEGDREAKIRLSDCYVESMSDFLKLI